MSGQITPVRLTPMQSSIVARTASPGQVGLWRRSRVVPISALLVLCAGVPALAQKPAPASAPLVVRVQSPASSKSQSPTRTAAQSTASLPDILEMLDNALTGIVAETSSCVVTIEGRRTRTRQQPQTGGDRSPDWHTQGAPMPPNADRNRNSGRPDGRPYNYRNFSTEITGSGFLTEGGYVVTTAEVAEQTIDPIVVMPDGRHIRVAGMNADRQSNIAILRIITQDSVSGLRWGDSEKVRPGCLAITIGNQSGFAASAGLGMVAATHRAAFSGNHRYQNLIQFQGAISGGSSGGPLLNSRGEVVGMVIAMPASGSFDPPNGRHGSPANPDANEKERVKEAGQGSNQRNTPPSAGADARDTGHNGADRSELERVSEGGAQPPRTTVIMISSASSMGFALPANDIHRIVDALKAGVKDFPKHGWLGLRPVENGPEGSGVVVGTVWIDGPADRAGIQPGDILIELQNSTIHSWSDVRPFFGGLQEGQTLMGKVRRGMQDIMVKLAISPRPDGEAIKRMKTKQLPPHVGMAEQNTLLGG